MPDGEYSATVTVWEPDAGSASAFKTVVLEKDKSFELSKVNILKNTVTSVEGHEFPLYNISGVGALSSDMESSLFNKAAAYIGTTIRIRANRFIYNGSPCSVDTTLVPIQAGDALASASMTISKNGVEIYKVTKNPTEIYYLDTEPIPIYDNLNVVSKNYIDELTKRKNPGLDFAAISAEEKKKLRIPIITEEFKNGKVFVAGKEREEDRLRNMGVIRFTYDGANYGGGVVEKGEYEYKVQYSFVRSGTLYDEIVPSGYQDVRVSAADVEKGEIILLCSDGVRRKLSQILST